MRGGLLTSVLQIGDLLLQCSTSWMRLRMYSLLMLRRLDVGHILGLRLVDAEADHQVGDDLGVLLRLPDDGDGLVDVQQDALQTQQQVQLLLLAAEDEVHPPPHALRAPCGPLLQHLPHPHHPGHPGDEDVEVAG